MIRKTIHEKITPYTIPALFQSSLHYTRFAPPRPHTGVRDFCAGMCTACGFCTFALYVYLPFDPVLWADSALYTCTVPFRAKIRLCPVVWSARFRLFAFLSRAILTPLFAIHTPCHFTLYSILSWARSRHCMARMTLSRAPFTFIPHAILDHHNP